MQRSSRGRSAAPRAAAAPPPQSRGAHTAAAPAGHAPAQAHHAPAPPAAAPTAQPQQPGMIAQMAATAGSVAIGSTIGHGLSNMLFGGSNHAAAPAEQAVPTQQQQMTPSCEIQAKGALAFLLISSVSVNRILRVHEVP